MVILQISNIKIYMKKNRKSVFIMLLFACLLTSCNQESQMDLASNQLYGNNHKVTVEEAKRNVMDFITNLNQKTRSSCYNNVTISSIEAISLSKNTRTVSSADLDSLFYILNFCNNKGFAIASTDNRETPILALIDNGNYSYNDNDTTNAGFAAFMDGIIEHEVEVRKNFMANDGDGMRLPDPVGPGGGNGGPGGDYHPDNLEVMSPLLKTKWNQINPYNKFCPGKYTGCVITAVSQICSYLQTPGNIRYNFNGDAGATILNWTRINDECNQFDGRVISIDLEDQIARLMRFWGGTFSAKYKDDRTDVKTKDAIKIMRNDYGFNISGLDDYNIDHLIGDLKQGNRIILMRGYGRYYHDGFVFRHYVDGHAWVVDGYIDQFKNNIETKYIHCNWGWGGSRNGYFLSSSLNAEENPVYNDDISSRTRSADFRYKLQTATFLK